MLLLSSVGMNVSAQEIVTKKSTISKNTKVDIYKATVQSGNGERTYRVFAQTSKKYKKNSYNSLHGCAVCSLTTVLSGYSKKYRNYTPNKTSRILEKKVFGSSRWNANYRKSLGAQRPVSLYGISKVLSYCNISNRYIRFFKDKTAVRQIEKHLKTGNPVIIEVKGEEDLAVLPCILNAPKDTFILYGQPKEGVVLVCVNEAFNKAKHFYKQLNKE